MRLLVGVLLFFMGSTAHAQTVTVRSGEHADFSRLVFRIPPDTGWQLGRIQAGYRLVFDTEMEQIDTTRAFDLIPRDRLEDLVVEATNDTVGLTVTCACYAEAFLFRPDMLVVDIRDGEAPEGSVFEQSLAATESVPEETSTQFVLAERTAPRPAVFPLLFDRPELEVPSASQAPLPEANTPSGPVATEDAENERVEQANQTLLKEISRAASQGLLEPAVKEIPVLTVPAPQQEEPATQPVVPIEPPDTTDLADHLTLRAESRIDRDIGALFQDELRRTVDGDRCIPDTQLEIATWADQTPFPEQIGLLREALVGEFDAVSEPAVMDLARFYVHFGFGAEAGRLLDMVDEPSEDKDLLASMAHIVDRGLDPMGGPFAEQLACDTYVALWAALSTQRLARGAEINTNAVLRGFGALPGHLKRHLGPGLSDRFITLGDTETARLILKDMGRTPGDHQDRLSLSEARLDVAMDQPEDAVEELETVVEENNNLVAAEAVVDLIDTLIVDGMPITDETAMLVSSLAFEYRRDALGPILARAEALALAGTGRYAQALARTKRAAFPDDLSDDTVEQITTLLHKNAEDSEFAALATGALRLKASQLSREMTLQVAQRLSDIGLNDKAQIYLDAHPRPDPTEAESLLAAKVSLAQSDPNAAVRHLLGLQSEAADAVRAEAYTALSAHDRAQPIYAEQGDAMQSDLSSFRSEDWESLAASSRDGQRGLANLLLAPLVPLPNNWAPDSDAEDQRVLDEARGLIQRSSLTRRTLVDALAEYPVEPTKPSE